MSQPSGSGSEGSPYLARTVSSEPAQYGGTPETEELLEKVVRETLALGASEEPLGAADMRRLQEVARRHPGTPMEGGPALAELIYTLLEEKFVGVASADVLKTAASHIAQTLWDDPTSKARLQRLWTRLCGGAL